MQFAEYKAGHLLCTWQSDRGFIKTRGQPQRSRAGSLLQAFLPEGYPDSVTADYANFQVWDSIQAICSYIRGILTSQAMLTGVGVGQEAATPLSAVLQFFLRDLSGMLGGVTFAFLQGSRLDIYAKQWRLFADCLNNVGLLMELASPLVPSLFLLLACLGSIARAITGVAAGSTRAALTLHFAKQNNAADISAKEGTQETATTLVGMLLGMSFTHVANALHVYANTKAVRALTLSSLNPSRLKLLTNHFLEQGLVLNPVQAAKLEPLAPPPIQRLLELSDQQCPTVIMGASLSQLVLSNQCNLEQLCSEADDEAYMIAQTGNAVQVILSRSSSPTDLLKAFVHANMLITKQRQLQAPIQVKGVTSRGQAQDWMQQHWGELLQQMQATGWQTKQAPLAQSDHTAEWGHKLSTHMD